MEFKIDTKDNYTILSPDATRLDVNLTDALRQKWEELTKSGRKNLIVDFYSLKTIEESALESLARLHETVYAQNQSLVFCRMNSDCLSFFKAKDLELVLNFAPTFEEAIDIVSMEILERELFSEEDEEME